LFEAHFFVKDCFGEPIEQLEIIRQVGFNPSPTASGSIGFDVVSIMFAMHYAFASEDKARMMLRNVAGALKRGGRLIGCIPSSDVIGARVRDFNNNHNKTTTTTTDGDTAEWGNSIYRVRFPGPTPTDGVFRPAFGWRYSFFLHEAVEEVPEYVVPWEAFRALAEDFNLELQYRRPFLDVWEAERDDPVLGPLAERMGVCARGGGGPRPLLMTDEEKEAAAFYTAFCFYKV
jgi:mRNA (guanine-N7-)-methyltransferase